MREGGEARERKIVKKEGDKIRDKKGKRGRRKRQRVKHTNKNKKTHKK